MTSPRRALAVAGLLAVLLGALLVAWFAAGWADVRGRQRTIRGAPGLAAAQRGAALAHELRGELGALLSREVERPYFHYQNLFHDPRASGGPSVAPSPLASVPDDALVLGYFQVDATGRATTPTINDEVPELSEPTRVADHQRFRDEVTRSLAGALTPRRSDRMVAVADAPPHRPTAPEPVAQTPRRLPVREPAASAPPQAQSSAPPQVQSSAPPQVQSSAPPQAQSSAPPQVQSSAPPQVQAAAPQAQVVTLDRSSYAQNAMSNQVYLEQQRPAPQPAVPPDRAASSAAPAPDPIPPVASEPTAAAPPSGAARKPRRTAAPSSGTRTPGPAPTAPVAITVSPLEWRTLAFAGQPTVVAVRHVDTPDGRLTQGFVVDRNALTGWLATHAADTIAELRTGDNATTEIVPGWHLELASNSQALAAAATGADAIARGFVLQFVTVAIVAVVAAWLVVMLVARAERLARERSQFAAAAAHELRTPLAGLQLYGDMIADGLGDPAKLRDYARRMSEEAARLGRVVSNVLGFSQLERGNLSLEPRTGALDEALRELADRAQPALDRAGATLALDVAPALTARFDRDALARIVGNLLDNAEKYGRDATDRTIRLAARPTSATIEVIVSDRGPGIATAARARLFQPFARGVSSDGPAGLGLGLALSQSLARAMGGDLVYRPADEGGASFVLILAHV